ncbi:MAG: YmdB family metallophosphoesterase [Kiritimatiellae bacterium]|nr:YmdB family metallophosphoesterase [Kiritimatiellia bacterium]
MKILHIGDIVGAPGRLAFHRIAIPMKKNGEVDAIVVNGENAAAGRGITPAIAEDLLNAGADVITLGDHTWDQKELAPYLDVESRIIRPLNFTSACPGRGWITVETLAGPLTVIQAIGRVFMQPTMDCPFAAMRELFAKDLGFAPNIVVDFHAEATSEKIAMGRFLDGKASSVMGTHTHVQTSDLTLLPGGTAYLTDLGMTGPKDSVLGRDVDAVIRKFFSGMPTKLDVAKDWNALEGAWIETDEKGRAVDARLIREYVEQGPPDFPVPHKQ